MSNTPADYMADRGFSAPPAYVADLDRCRPRSALSPDAGRGHWRAMSYETESLSGVMLTAGPETAAPEVTYPLRARGWHAISIGVMGDGSSPVQAMARLTGDRTFSILSLPPVTSVHREYLHELFWKVADLTGQGLVLAQMSWQAEPGEGRGAVRCATTQVAYLKLVPLTEPEVAHWKAERERGDTRRLYAHNDAHTVNCLSRPTTAEEIRRHVEPYRDGDFARLYWEAGAGDLLQYFSKIGRVPTYDGLDDFSSQHYRWGAESWRAFRDQGIDPFQVALDHAHDIGLEFHASYRVAGFHFPPMHDHFNYGDSFYKAHPEFRGVDREGRPTPRASYAYPEVRRFVISLLREMGGFRVDGVCLLYNRRPPLLDYEPPLVEGFRAEYGRDPRRLDERDPRWLSHRAGTLTQFMREVREAMDSVAREQGRPRRLEVSAVVMSDEEENLFNGMDLKTWVDEGLVDTLIPYTSARRLDSTAGAWTDPGQVEYFVNLTRGTPCKLAVNIMPRVLTPEAYRRKAAMLYAAGVEHLFFWDSDVQQSRNDGSGPWSALRRLGHREEIEAWVRDGEPSLAGPRTPLRKLSDWDLSYVSPG